EGRRCKRLGDGIGNAAAHLVVPFGRLSRLAVPLDVDAELSYLLAGGVERGARREALPLVGAQVERLAFALAELEHLGNGLSEGPEAGLVFPHLEETGSDPVEHRVDRGLFPFP